MLIKTLVEWRYKVGLIGARPLPIFTHRSRAERYLAIWIRPSSDRTRPKSAHDFRHHGPRFRRRLLPTATARPASCSGRSRSARHLGCGARHFECTKQTTIVDGILAVREATFPAR